MARVRCVGWWEQAGYGRQAMHDLILAFADGRIEGSGVDVIGEFTFAGTLSGNQVHLLKQYIGKHRIEYHGTSVGEGAYGGRWGYGGYQGQEWFIRVVGYVDGAKSVEIGIGEEICQQ